MNKTPKFSWVWFTINLILFSSGVFFLFSANADYTKYNRPCIILKKNQSEHQHKSNYYPDYYFTVQWCDRENERETFEVSPECYFDTDVKDKVYFKRAQKKYEWIKGGFGFLLLISIFIVWLISGMSAIGRRGYLG